MRWLFLPGLLFLLSFSATAQTVNFHGEIKDSYGTPLVFASVWITEAGKGTATNQTGFFQINLLPGTYKFTIRQLGYVPLTETITVGHDKFAGTFELKRIPKAETIPDVNIIIDNAIARRDTFRRGLPAYAGQLYNKSLQQLDGRPKSLF